MKYLIFSKTPFEHEPYPSDKEMVEKNLFGNNVGNLFFANSVIKSLRAPENEIVRYSADINTNIFDRGILYEANLIQDSCLNYVGYCNYLLSTTDIPVVLAGVGTDSLPNFDLKINCTTALAVKKLFSEILKRTPSIGVRGKITKDAVVNLCGIPEEKIDVIGCPSVRYYGRNLINKKDFKQFSKDLKIAVNFTGYHYDIDEAVYLHNILKRFNNSFVIFTDTVEAYLLWKGATVPYNRYHELLPCSPEHFILKQHRARFMANEAAIINMLKSFDFSIGSRIHQAIVSLLAGTPAIVIAHSTRVLELAQYHNIPYIMRDEFTDYNKLPSLEMLYERAIDGINKFYESYNSQLHEYSSFMQKNNLKLNDNWII